ncbi:sigma-54-dependent transcriptional regulator [Desulfofustis glycolicus]|uniref:DNA-binding transcriptional response regulator, NtrC family, contains REC, AAA-type ATPase, and a Fis-type DNA-binding domains n=1 Tax=Desulfofustis glycolicus DSM 9705 TaxID=1121409 RepID=A0A1M5XZ08_9BACT|nr:sigma 54-interacting transcriptional regulator [Desulfofustis glycolicus]MCB2218272.1 sigma 54-interacting transcriptional regulator [Desulfobulbaceae bacterium]SHI05045.1 DNA-binding transcriptional response regulator, NtrC family, contains REC, AAA-type ATPase, and a Fis-type DNA-binding domains [Desulfofustis glycolicus DSM 9705]
MDKGLDPFSSKALATLAGAVTVQGLLQRTRELLRTTCPVSLTALYCVDPDSAVVRLGGLADQDGGRRDERELGDTPDIIRAVQTIGAPIQLARRASLSAAAKPLVQHGLIAGDASLIIIRLIIDESLFSLLFVSAEPGKEFTAEHGRVCKSLRLPLAISLGHCLKHDRLRDRCRCFEADIDYLGRSRFEGEGVEVIGADLGLRTVMNEIRRVAGSDCPLLIRGEPGVGKGLLAKTSHFLSARQRRPYLECQLRLVPEGQRGGTLFGGPEPAGSGGPDRRAGLFPRATGGTVALRGVESLAAPLRQRLRGIIEGGADLQVRTGVRCMLLDDRCGERSEGLPVLSGTSSIVTIDVPPLRERREDIPRLLHYFLERVCLGSNRQLPVIDQASLQRCLDYHWPGNVGELRAVVERALLLTTEEVLRLPIGVEQEARQGGSAKLVHLDRLVADHIRRALQATGGKIAGPDGAAALLGVNPSTLRKRMRKLQIPFGRGVTY